MKTCLLLVSLLLVSLPVLGHSTESVVPEFAGEAIHFVSPTDGQRVVAGDSLLVQLMVDEGVELSNLLVSFRGGMMILDAPYRQKILIDAEQIGTMEFGALAKTVSGHMVSSPTVFIEVVAGKAELVSISDRSSTSYIYGPGCIESLYIYGTYADGVERDLTDYGTHFSVVEGSDRVCVTEDGVVVARSPGTAVVLAENSGHEVRIPITVMDGDCANNPPKADLQHEYAGKVGEELCFDAAGVRDFDTCLGEPLNPDLFYWRVSLQSDEYEGHGYTFCIVPEQAGFGLVQLEVTDVHGAKSTTVAMVRVE